MEAHKAASPTWMNGSVPITDFQLSDAEVSDGRVMAVDIGGGAGHQMLALRRAFPELKGRLVVQDVALMIDQVDRTQAAASGLEPMVHDFYTPQPVKNAKVYYLRTVLHDWGDEQSQRILARLREAMASDSVIVIDEIVVPAKGASIMQTNFDVTMMAAVGAMERSEKQWRELLSDVGLKIRDIWIYDGGLNSGLIIAVPA
jgi:demethylsterigmatocystin 6-O-methyltransferase